MNLHSRHLSDKCTQNTQTSLQPFWWPGCQESGTLAAWSRGLHKCEGSLQISDSDEKCVPVRWLTPEQPRPAGTEAIPHPPPETAVPSIMCCTSDRAVPHWAAITWWGVAVISLITGHSCPISLNITWLSWPRPHARLKNKATEKCAPRGSYDSVNSCDNPLQGKEGAKRNSLKTDGPSIINACPSLNPLELHFEGE